MADEDGSAPQPPPRTRRATPWDGPPRRADVICLAAISLSGVYYLVLLPLRPLLLAEHTLLLVALTGSTESLIAAGAFLREGRLPLLPLLPASLLGLMKFDLLYWWAGRLWGPRFAEFLVRRERSDSRLRRWLDRWQARLSRLVSRFTPLAIVLAQFLPFPSAIFYAAAGWEGMGVGWFLLLDGIGQLLWAAALTGLGWALGARAVAVVQTISTYGLWIAVALVLLIAVRAVWSARRSGETSAQ